jgi:hypothetical protein
VLYLHIDIFWAGERDASALLLRVIALSWPYSCRDNALDGGPKHWALQEWTCSFSGDQPLEHESRPSHRERKLCFILPKFVYLQIFWKISEESLSVASSSAALHVIPVFWCRP